MTEGARRGRIALTGSAVAATMALAAWSNSSSSGTAASAAEHVPLAQVNSS